MSELSRAPVPVLEPGARALVPLLLRGHPARQGLAPLRWIVANGRIAFGGTVVGIAALVAVFAPALAPQQPEAQYVQLRLAPPGSAFAPHIHHGDEFTYIMEGAVDIDVAGQGTKSFKAGDSIHVNRDAVHGGKVASATPAKLRHSMVE